MPEKGAEKSALTFALPAFFLLGCALLSLGLVSPCLGEDMEGFLEKDSAGRHVLENGMVVIIKEVHTQPVAAVAAYVRAGSSTEAEFMGSGISHFVEHMLFKGTEKRGVGEVRKQVSSYGGDISGFTGKDYTGYSIVVPSEHCIKALDLLADSLMNPSFDREEFAKERDVILKEIKLNRDDPERRVRQVFWSNAFLAHPYRHPIIGYEPLFKKLTRDDLFKYHRLMYAPNNIVLAVVGDIDARATLAGIKEIFKAFERRPVAPLGLAPEPKQVNTRRADIDFAVSQAHLILGFHTVDIRDDDLYPLDVLAIVLGQGESSRLNQELRRKKKLVYAIGAGNYTPKYPGAFFISGLTDEKQLEATIEAILLEIEAVKQELIKDEELDKAKRKVLSQYVFSQETVEGQAHELLTNEIFAGDINFSQRYVRGINSVTREDIKRVAREYLTRDNLTIATLSPLGSMREEDKAKKAGVRGIGDIHKQVLPNGLTVLLREDPTLPMVSIRLVFKGGVRRENKTNNGITNLTIAMLAKGTKNRDAREIDELIESRGIEFSTYCGNNSFGINLDLLARDLDKGLDLLSDILINPAFPEEEIALEKEQILAGLRNEEDDIFRVSSNLLRKTLFKSHPYQFNPRGDKEVVAGLERSRLIDFYSQVCTPRNMVLAIFGDIDRESTLNKVRQSVGLQQQAAEQKSAVPEEPRQTKVRRESKHLPKEQLVVMLGFHGTDIYDKDRFTFEAISAVLSRGQGRIYEEIRDKLGLAYTLGAYSVEGIDPGYYVFYVATTLDKLGLVKEKLFEEIELLKTVSVGDEELVRAKTYLKGTHKINLATSSALAFQSSLDELYGLGYDHYKEYEARIDGVTAQDIMRVARQYFALDKYTLVVVGPVER